MSWWPTSQPAEADELSGPAHRAQGRPDADYDDTTDHYNKDAVSALPITFDYPEDDDQCLEALDRVNTSPTDIYVSTSLGNTQQETIDAEVRVIMVYVAVIVISNLP